MTANTLVILSLRDRHIQKGKVNSMIFKISAFVLLVGGGVMVAAAQNSGKARTGLVTGELKSRKDATNRQSVTLQILAPGEEKARFYILSYNPRDPKAKDRYTELRVLVDAARIGDRVECGWVNSPEGAEGGFFVTKFCVLNTQAESDKMAPTLEETLAWLKKMPTMSGSAIGPKKERDCFQKLTALDLDTLTELHIGGHLIKDGKFQPGHVEFPADEYRHLTALPSLEKLDFMENGLGDAALIHVGKIGTLTHLTFGDHQVTDAGLKHLANLKKLSYLNLCFPDKAHGGMISDKGLDEIARITSLETLDLRATQITDVGLTKLKALPRLKDLLLNGTAITDLGLGNLHAIKSLRMVSVFNCKGVTPDGIAALRKALPGCEVITAKAK